MKIEVVIEVDDDYDRYVGNQLYWLRQTSLSYRVLTKKEWPDTGASAYKVVRKP